MIDSLYILSEQILLWFFILVGLSLLVQAKSWLHLVKWMLAWEDRHLQFFCMLYCMAYLPFGLFIVLVHNEWVFSYSVVVTLLGWLTCLQCATFLVYPPAAVQCTRWIYGNKSDNFLKIYFSLIGALYILLGMLIWSLHW